MRWFTFALPGGAVLRPPNQAFRVGRKGRAHAKEFAGSGFDGGALDVIPPCPAAFTTPPARRVTTGAGIPIATGTPAGIGFEPLSFLSAGDIVRIEVPGIGAIKTTFP